MVDASVENLDESISSLDSDELSVSASLKHLRWVLAVRGHMLEGLDAPNRPGRAMGPTSLRKSLAFGRQSIEPESLQKSIGLNEGGLENSTPAGPRFGRFCFATRALRHHSLTHSSFFTLLLSQSFVVRRLVRQITKLTRSQGGKASAVSMWCQSIGGATLARHLSLTKTVSRSESGDSPHSRPRPTTT